ncbi:MAG: Asp-tRNA(Asn)/Glu-tRNA(Gln) amidotransferase subunit GatC [Anaerolineaceae bacterium]
MALTPDVVRQIANLARLELSGAEVNQYCSQLSAILDYAARLQAIDTSGIPPTSSVLPLGSILREDEPRAGLTRDEILEIAPKTKRGQYQVPPVFE